jgi:hypothetical protein
LRVPKKAFFYNPPIIEQTKGKFRNSPGSLKIAFNQSSFTPPEPRTERRHSVENTQFIWLF